MHEVKMFRVASLKLCPRPAGVNSCLSSVHHQFRDFCQVQVQERLCDCSVSSTWSPAAVGSNEPPPDLSEFTPGEH